MNKTKSWNSKPFRSLQKYTESLTFHLYSIWLFTFSDLKTIVVPSTAFALFNSLAIILATESPSSTQHSLQSSASAISARVPSAVLWVWLNLLPFTIDNQRQPSSIEEDSLNKPWRVFPSRRLSPSTAKGLILILYSVAVLTSILLSTIPQCLILILLGILYNDLHGADASCLIRNFINACGFLCFTTGAMQVTITGTRERENESSGGGSALQLLGKYPLLIAGIVFTTVQTQDMYDQRGDSARDRKTVPLVIGDAPARWSIALPMCLWCWLAPWFCGGSLLGYVVPGLLGLWIAARTLKVRNENGDRVTFRLWNAWMIAMYAVPLISVLERRFWGTMRLRPDI